MRFWWKNFVDTEIEDFSRAKSNLEARDDEDKGWKNQLIVAEDDEGEAKTFVF